MSLGWLDAVAQQQQQVSCKTGVTQLIRHGKKLSIRMSHGYKCNPNLCESRRSMHEIAASLATPIGANNRTWKTYPRRYCIDTNKQKKTQMHFLPVQIPFISYGNHLSRVSKTHVPME
jgi:hypothetical protein